MELLLMVSPLVLLGGGAVLAAMRRWKMLALYVVAVLATPFATAAALWAVMGLPGGGGQAGAAALLFFIPGVALACLVAIAIVIIAVVRGPGARAPLSDSP